MGNRKQVLRGSAGFSLQKMHSSLKLRGKASSLAIKKVVDAVSGQSEEDCECSDMKEERILLQSIDIGQGRPPGGVGGRARGVLLRSCVWVIELGCPKNSYEGWR